MPPTNRMDPFAELVSTGALLATVASIVASVGKDVFAVREMTHAAFLHPTVLGSESVATHEWHFPNAHKARWATYGLFPTILFLYGLSVLLVGIVVVWFFDIEHSVDKGIYLAEQVAGAQSWLDDVIVGIHALETLVFAWVLVAAFLATQARFREGKALVHSD